VNLYNDNDPAVCAWVERLVAAGRIPPGDVICKSITEISSDDCRGYAQCHFFCGIAGWPVALAVAGWPADKPVWTGSCPCQPFSAAGRGEGAEDERHLWPAFHSLISECKPSTVFGEQVASADGRLWLTAVRSDLEALGYAVGAADLCAAGVGAPHIRQRLYWVAHCKSGGQSMLRWPSRQTGLALGGGSVGGLANPKSHGWGEDQRSSSRASRLEDGAQELEGRSLDGGLADPNGSRSEAGLPAPRQGEERDTREPDHSCRQRGGHEGAPAGPYRVASESPWARPDFLFCRDGKWRPVEPGISPLAYGVPERVVQLRGYGNAINPYQAEVFIRAANDNAAKSEAA